jgi:hypothetical protein
MEELTYAVDDSEDTLTLVHIVDHRVYEVTNGGETALEDLVQVLPLLRVDNLELKLLANGSKTDESSHNGVLIGIL